MFNRQDDCVMNVFLPNGKTCFLSLFNRIENETLTYLLTNLKFCIGENLIRTSILCAVDKSAAIRCTVSRKRQAQGENT